MTPALQVALPGPVAIRWREGNRWREVSSEFRPQTREERVAFEAARLVWSGRPLVESRRAAEVVANWYGMGEP